jgi:hypothetical protein
MLKRDEDGAKPQHKLQHQKRQNTGISECAACPDARIEKPPVEQHEPTHQCHRARDSTGDHRQELLKTVTDTKRVKDLDGGQKPDKMAEENHQYADMKKDGTHYQLFPAQEL